MACVTGAVVCCFQTDDGATLAAVWDGGTWANIHHVVRGQPAGVIERWHVWNRGRPALEHTPSALAELVAYRLEQIGPTFELPPTPAERVACRGLPAFSLN